MSDSGVAVKDGIAVEGGIAVVGGLSREVGVDGRAKSGRWH
jgi:hypothetical protein